MKLFKMILSFLLVLMMLAGCTPQVTPTDSEPPENDGVDMYADGTGMNLLVGIDEFDRVLPIKTSDREEKIIGMFYWLWHGTYVDKVVDTSKIIAEKGVDYALSSVHEYNPTFQPHYWGEPLYGYYTSEDEYVLRKHLEMLSYAGVDFIMFDATNTLTYPTVVRKLCNIIIELQKEGFDPPQIAYCTHTASIQTVLQAYNEIYRHEEYRDAWFCYQGKPLMVAQTDPDKDRERTRSQHAHLASYDPKPLPKKVADFFTFRTPAWVGVDPATDQSWPWIDWHFPPEIHGNLMCVSPASHHYAMFSWAAMDEDERYYFPWGHGNVSWGRGYSFAKQKNISEDATKGTFYNSTWTAAHNADPEIVYVSGWNEWMCGVGKNEPDDEKYSLYDSFNMEFSRDLEPMKGGYNDAFLMQTAINVRKFLSDKEIDPSVKIKTPVKKTIDINRDISQWNDVDAIYRFFGSDNSGRKSMGATREYRYVIDAAKNAIQTVKVTADKDNIYMMLSCSNDITLTAENSLNIFIGTGTPSRKGWEGYDFVINRERTADTASIMTLDADGNTTSVGSAKIKVSGKTMQVEIPKALLNMQSDAFYFKVADSVENITDIMDYYVTGRSMPMGRFSFQYLG